MFLATKLFLPPLQPDTLHRDRLYGAVDRGLAGGVRLILLSAPPRYGKTTLLSSWVQRRGRPCAWVSLDEGENDPARFLSLVLHSTAAHTRPDWPG